MKVAFFDCFSGIAGDMILGALIDLGVDGEYLKKEMEKINFSGYEIKIRKIKKNNINAIDVCVSVKEKQHHRSLSEINDIIDNSDLPLVASIPLYELPLHLVADSDNSVRLLETQNLYVNNVAHGEDVGCPVILC